MHSTQYLVGFVWPVYGLILYGVVAFLVALAGDWDDVPFPIATLCTMFWPFTLIYEGLHRFLNKPPARQ